MRILLSLIAFVACSAFAADMPSDATSPPIAKRVPKDVSVHGDKRIDDYFWLREKDKPEVLAYLRAENDYANAWFKPMAGFTDKLYHEMVARIQEDDEAVPYRKAGYWYSSRTAKGKQYATYIRRKGSLSAPEEPMLDMNALAEGKRFLRLGAFAVSPNSKLLAYALDETGARDFTLYVKDLASGAALPVRIEKTSGAVWANDSKTLYYLTKDEAKRDYRLWRHTIGQQGADKLLVEEKDELFELNLDKTRDDFYVVVTSFSKDTTEQQVIAADEPLSAPRVVLPRKKGLEYFLDHRIGQFYLRVNDTGRNFRLVQTSAAKPSLESARELIAHRPAVMIEDVDLFLKHMVVRERDQGAQKLRVWSFANNQSHYVAFDEKVYTASGIHNAEYDTTEFRFEFSSLVTPTSVYDYDMDRRTLALKKRQPVLGGYDPKLYQSEQITARSADGTEVPISLVYRRDLRKAGPQPLLLYGYGSYGFAIDPGFSSPRVSLLDRGVIFAIAHIRGGGDLGRVWYDNGKLAKKMNTFTDFVAAADTLVARGYTERSQLVIQGGSAGGLLMGAVVNLRPELFKAVVAEVPFVDVINTMLDETLPLTTGEFLEWGNPKVKADYEVMRRYSPYDNLKPGAYPAIYLRTSLNDSQVPYWEPAKYLAKLRTLKTDHNPLLMSINLDAGHGGASGRYDALKERAQTYTFMLSQWGLVK
jgi:oligopeptidase B